MIPVLYLTTNAYEKLQLVLTWINKERDTDNWQEPVGISMRTTKRLA